MSIELYKQLRTVDDVRAKECVELYQNLLADKPKEKVAKLLSGFPSPESEPSAFMDKIFVLDVAMKHKVIFDVQIGAESGMLNIRHQSESGRTSVATLRFETQWSGASPDTGKFVFGECETRLYPTLIKVISDIEVIQSSGEFDALSLRDKQIDFTSSIGDRLLLMVADNPQANAVFDEIKTKKYHFSKHMENEVTPTP